MPCAFCGRWLAGSPPWRRLRGTPQAWNGLGIVHRSTDQAGDDWVTTCDWRLLDHVDAELQRGQTQIEAAQWDLNVLVNGTAGKCDRPGARHGRAGHARYAEGAAGTG